MLMLAGLGLDLLYRRELPAAIPDLGEVFRRAVALRPSGFLALGLLMLIATPVLRVIGSIIAFCREHGIAENTFYRWRKAYGGMSVSEVQRLKELEKENARLKRLLAE